MENIIDNIKFEKESLLKVKNEWNIGEENTKKIII